MALHINEITVNRILGLKLFKVQPGKMTLIAGGNRAGKSSFIQAFRAAFKSPGTDPDFIHENGEKGTIEVKLNNAIEIRRTVTRNGSTVVVKHAGETMNKPQAFLDSLLDERNFNPAAFILADKRERRRVLLAALPITLDVDKIIGLLGDIEAKTISRTLNWDRFDFTQHGLVVAQQIRDVVYDQRHTQGQRVRQLSEAIKQDRADMPPTVDVTRFKDFDHKAKLAEFEEAQAAVATHERKCDKLRSIQGQAERLVESIERLKQEIKQKQQELEGVKGQGADLRHEVESFEQPPVDQMRAEMEEFQDHQKQAYKSEEIEKRETLLIDERVHHEQLDKLVKIMGDTLPRLLLSETKLPIDGLEFQGDDTLINGRSIDKLSTSEQMRLVVKIAVVTMNKGLKACCLDRFESLDDLAQKEFIKEAAAYPDVQWFIAKVTKGPLATTQVEENQASSAA